MKPTKLLITFADPAIENAFRDLRRAGSVGQRRLAQALSAAIDALRKRYDEGITLTGEEIPEFLRTRYALGSLRRLDILPHWRVFYTIGRGNITILDLTCDGFT